MALLVSPSKLLESPEGRTRDLASHLIRIRSKFLTICQSFSRLLASQTATNTLESEIKPTVYLKSWLLRYRTSKKSPKKASLLKKAKKRIMRVKLKKKAEKEKETWSI